MFLVINGGIVFVMFSEVLISMIVNGIIMISRMIKGIDCSMFIMNDNIV